MFLLLADAVLVVVMHVLYRLHRLYTLQLPLPTSSSSPADGIIAVLHHRVVVPVPTPGVNVHYSHLPKPPHYPAPHCYFGIPVRDALRFPRIPVALLDPGTTQLSRARYMSILIARIAIGIRPRLGGFGAVQRYAARA